jgi:hypothetical protein
MVRAAGGNLLRPVKLFNKDKPYKLMRKNKR